MHILKVLCETHLGLHHSRSLGTQDAHCLEDIQHTLVLHTL